MFRNTIRGVSLDVVSRVAVTAGAIVNDVTMIAAVISAACTVPDTAKGNRSVEPSAAVLKSANGTGAVAGVTAAPSRTARRSDRARATAS